MNRLIYIFVFCLFSVLSVPMFGQGNVDVRSDQIEGLRKAIADAIVEIDSLRIVTAVPGKELEHERNSLKDRLDDLQNSNDSLQIEIDKKKHTVSDTERETKNNTVYRDKQQKRQSAEREERSKREYEEGRRYLDRRYSEMSSDTLQILQKDAEQYSEMQDFEEYKNRLERSLEIKKLYDGGVAVINGPCTPDEIWNIGRELGNLLDTDKNVVLGKTGLTSVQYSELDTLYTGLVRYNNGKKELKKIVLAINNDREIQRLRKENDPSKKEECIGLIRKIIEPEQGTEEYEIHQKYFGMVPYLKKLLDDYWGELQDNPFPVPTETEKDINKLEVR